jgi:histidinol dehydrogenase
VPTPDGKANPAVLLAAKIAGVDEIYRVGGAQAIAALAYGTETIAPVDMITGPGNAFVAAAKRRVFGRVGIDMIAGPSEILVIADCGQNPDWIALDMLSQAEHDESAQAILITDDAQLAADVGAAIERHLETLERRDIAGASWRDFGAIITVPDLDAAAALSNRIAPEHLELCVDDPDALSARITSPSPTPITIGLPRRAVMIRPGSREEITAIPKVPSTWCSASHTAWKRSPLSHSPMRCESTSVSVSEMNS